MRDSRTIAGKRSAVVRVTRQSTEDLLARQAEHVSAMARLQAAYPALAALHDAASADLRELVQIRLGRW